jgi:FkbH-like protein
VVGDDGLGGIQIGQGSAAGEAYSSFQQYIKRLQERGVLLAVCSKNDDRIARAAFTDHPDMVLSLDHFVVFKANWALKSDNIRAIARELDLPLEALVFVDDNPAERAEVAQAVPEVAIVSLPDDPGGYVRALDRAQLFEVSSLTAEDLGRSILYRARQQTREARAQASDASAYLASLDMRATLAPFDAMSLERITQLVNKTNQFNLTTPRVVLAQMQQHMDDPDAVTCAIRLRDRFADHGLISVLFGRVDSRQLTIDAWLMSCRVLGRGVERAVFNYVLDVARTKGVDRIVGRYRATDRNHLVKDHYRALGFERVDEIDGVEHWHLLTNLAKPAETLITIEEGIQKS